MNVKGFASLNLPCTRHILTCMLLLLVVLRAPAVARTEASPAQSEPDPADTADRLLLRWDDGLTFTDPDENFSLSIGGRVQPRYQYRRPQQASDTSSFSLRRLRLEFRGHAYTKDLTWLITPELSGTASLRDGWVNFKFSDRAQLRIGQYNVPFAWQRDVSSNRHQFVERSAANDQFQWADGRDIGLMLHGDLSPDWQYKVGIFGGEGRNVTTTSTTGHLYTARLTFAAMGDYPRQEALVSPVEDVNLAFGAGLGYADNNAARNWYPYAAGPPQRADVFSTTGDVHLQTGPVSTNLVGFFRSVDPRQGGDSYRGTGFTVQAGYLIVPERLFAAIRYSAAKPNTDHNLGRERELLAGVQIYHLGHDSKFHVEAGQIKNHDGQTWLETDIFRVQYQLLF